MMIVCNDQVILKDGRTGVVIRRDSQGSGRASYVVVLEDGQQVRVRDNEVTREKPGAGRLL
jgi:hypothetical protein